MRRQQKKFFRNRLDLTDHVQVRVVRRRLRISEPELKALVGRVGNSIACLSKEVALRQAEHIATPPIVPEAAVIEATRLQETNPAGDAALSSPA